MIPSIMLTFYFILCIKIGSAQKEFLAISNCVQDFSYLKRLDDRCSKIGSKESDFLMSFWNDHLKCFQSSPDQTSKRVSISTTCSSLSAIAFNPSHWAKIAAWRHATDDNTKINIEDTIDSLINAKWSFEPFQTSLLVSTLIRFNCAVRAGDKFVEAVDTLLTQRSRISNHRNQSNSAYVRYHNARALLDVAESSNLPKQFRRKSDILYALERAKMVGFDELCRQIAFYNCGDSAHFDVVVLAYTLFVYVATAESLVLKSFSRGVLPTLNFKLVKAALHILFECQEGDGSWQKGEPYYAESECQDVGNNYVFFFDTVSALVNGLGTAYPEFLAPYLPNLERYGNCSVDASFHSSLATLTNTSSTRPCFPGPLAPWSPGPIVPLH